MFVISRKDDKFLFQNHAEICLRIVRARDLIHPSHSMTCRASREKFILVDCSALRY